MTNFKDLPGIDKLISDPSLVDWDQRLMRSVRVRLAQELVAELREQAKKGKAIPDTALVVHQLEKRFENLLRFRMQKVINATGVVLHTNLGRAPLPRELLSSMAAELDSYCSLEFDLSKGERGSRGAYVERLLSLLCGVPAAAVVNNNAAATYLALHTFARGKEVVISRGELVQIGGGYRVPDILAASGAKLVEVGTTNMTSIRDYENAVGPNTGMFLKVHQSNFFISGHTQSPSLSELVALSKKSGSMCVVDLGSGLLHATDWDAGEPTVESVMRSGVSLCCFSGDKLLGGPQAGILVGGSDVVAALRKSPLFRVLRLGKTELYLLEQTLLQYASGAKPLTWKLLEMPQGILKTRAEQFCRRLDLPFEIQEGFSSVGGGTMPSCQIPTVLIHLKVPDAEKFARALRRGEPAVVCRIENKNVLLDLRTVLPDEDTTLIQSISKAHACTL
ncbi:MAG: L-seryl-tRNA(Sec) selenium transferase [Bdellovibrionales bacterium]|nr:L-seryl-tRNA(Sec) selenium transferase [Bdellovibrionales bacterium]